MELYHTVVRFFQGGGEFMYPIAVVMALGAAVAIERYLFLTWTSANNQALWKKIVPFIQAGKFQEAVSITTGSKAAIGSILTYGLQLTEQDLPLRFMFGYAFEAIRGGYAALLQLGARQRREVGQILRGLIADIEPSGPAADLINNADAHAANDPRAPRRHGRCRSWSLDRRHARVREARGARRVR